MKKNVLAKAIGLTSAAMALGIASGQAAAVEFEAGDVMLDVYGYAQLNAVMILIRISVATRKPASFRRSVIMQTPVKATSMPTHNNPASGSPPPMTVVSA